MSAGSTLPLLNCSHHEYSRAQRGIDSDGSTTPRAKVSIADEACRLEAETENILVSQHGALSNSSKVLRRHKELSENNMRPVFNQMTCRPRAARRTSAQRNIDDVTLERGATALGNGGATAAEPSRPLGTQLDSESARETQEDSLEGQVSDDGG